MILNVEATSVSNHKVDNYGIDRGGKSSRFCSVVGCVALCKCHLTVHDAAIPLKNKLSRELHALDKWEVSIYSTGIVGLTDIYI